ncbi:AcrB/AcrD/AcrF family protein [Sphingomonas naphthae]|uniref:AcrB/AcrD/AcrF family protein n=1 Tax=Sphingomonas naphthae TaxID=1813468 RepID=A0ABY7TIY4_9SPHN|nr:AcrB/AcrD/AcrF family protein [Sphingomonas naphthae]WCT73177.1 AcrB/AcrD/AcrF family protein [Sphingomonas naphthae]
MLAKFVDETHWRRWFLAIWIGIACWMLWQRWAAIGWFALPDTDDNMRMMQVRGLLNGQGWYDLRQYRLDPPGGANIHWSRLVDLPIAGLILIGRLFVSGPIAEKFAVAVAPLLALGGGLYALMLAARRLAGPWAFLMAAAILVCANTPLAMWMPLRIDHHGWQLAFLMLMVAGIADPKRTRGGATAGIATAASLAIGLELMPYMALGGGLLMLWWALEGEEAPRLKAYAATLAAGSALGYLLFVSNDNRLPVCDALSPVWLSATLAAGAAAYGVASIGIERRSIRIVALLAVGVVLAGGFALAWPDCLGAPERLPPELKQSWFNNVREAKPIYRHGWRVAVPTAALPIIGALGAIVSAWIARASDRLMPWAAVAILSIAATALLFWQTRAGPAAQFLAVPGATALTLLAFRRASASRHMLVRVTVPVAAYLVCSSLVVWWVVSAIPTEKVSKVRKLVNRANRRCPTLPALRPIAMLPRATIMTFIDLSPRLIVATHHNAIAGPYHRNAQAILDVQHTFRATDPEEARGIIRRHGAGLVLICPGMSESTLYAARARDGFYMQLMRGKVPGWLQPVPLPEKSPFRLWRVLR